MNGLSRNKPFYMKKSLVKISNIYDNYRGSSKKASKFVLASSTKEEG